jgi:hypothetical protein
MWAGIAGAVVNGGKTFEIAISIHDSVYNTDFSSAVVPYTPTDPTKSASEITKHVLQTIKKFSQEHLCKFLGAGVTLGLLKEARVPSFPYYLSLPICPVSQPLH